MAQDMVRTPTSMTGILRFYDVSTGGPTIDPRAIVVFSVAFIALIKIVTIITRVS